MNACVPFLLESGLNSSVNHEKRGTVVEKRDKKYTAEVLREFSIFFAVLFFTCVVGIIELLPEFDKISKYPYLLSFGWIFLSILYFGLLFGIVFCIDRCFWLYDQNKRLAGEFGFNFPEIEPFYTKGKKMKKPLITVILLVFFMLYFVKIGVLQ